MRFVWVAVLVASCGVPPDGDPFTTTTEDTSCTSATFYADRDGDGFGDDESFVDTCSAPPGYVSTAGDCDDADPHRHPASTEVCNNGVDDDCNGLADDLDPGVSVDSLTTWYADADQDGVGSLVGTEACVLDGGMLTTGDCDDADPLLQDGVWWESEDGVRTEVTADFASGTASAPVQWSAPEAGTLLLCPGLHHATITGSGALTVRGPAGPSDTSLDGGHDQNGIPHTLIDNPGSDTTVAGIALRNAARAVVSGGGHTLLDGVVVEGLVGKDDLESGVYQELGSLEIRDSSFADNVMGSIVLAFRVSEARVERSSFASNRGNHALFLADGDITVRDVDVVDNVMSAHALRLGGAPSRLERVTVARNVGGGLWYTSSVDTEHVIEDSTIEGNQAPDGRGGGILFQGQGGGLALIDTVVAGNHSGSQGGGLYVGAGTGTIRCEAGKGRLGFVGNTSTGAGGGVFLSSSYTPGWANGDQRRTLDVQGCDFGLAGSVDDNDPDDVLHEDQEFQCPSSGPCVLVKDERTVYTHGDDATFCVGVGC